MLGTVGIFLPLLPTVPFYLAAAFLWAKSSDRLYRSLVDSPYYQKYVNELIINKKITNRGKLKMLTSLFIIMAIPFILIDNLHVRITLVIVYLAHLVFVFYYFNLKK